MSSPHSTPRQHVGWTVLVVATVAQFIVVLDTTIVNVALPSIQGRFALSAGDLQWVVTAYTLAFGGFLLLGGRLADLFGRKRWFLIALGTFGVASLVTGLSTSEGMLIAARAAQGLAAAVLMPAALSIILVVYADGARRNVALSVWGIVASAGGAVGALLGGVLTQFLDWRWNFFINVPVAIVVFVIALRVLPRHEEEEKERTLDIPGATTITLGIVAVVFGIVEAPTHGWTSAWTITAVVIGVLLIAAFVLIELGSRSPLVPFGIFKNRNVLGANLAMIPIMAGVFSSFFFSSLYMQRVLGYGPALTGLAFLVTPLFIMGVGSQGPRMLRAWGFKPVLVCAILVIALSQLLLSFVPVGGSYWVNVLPGFVLLGIGAGGVFGPITVAATSGVHWSQSGLASGLVNTSQQFGGSLGLAILTGIASSAAGSFHASRANDASASLAAQVHGYQVAFLVSAGFLLAATLIVAFVLTKESTKPERKAASKAEV